MDLNLVIKISLLLGSYLVGAIPFGFIFGKIKGIDLREHGSKNIGTTNTGRILGKKYAIMTYILDMLKGAIFVVLFRYEIINSEYMVLSPALYGLLATIGHTFPVYLKFKGGKAVATSSGVILGYSPTIFLVAALFFLITTYVSKMVSLGSLLATASAVFAAIILTIINNEPIINKEMNVYFLIGCFIMAIIIFVKHSANIKRIKNHTESKVKW